MISTPERDREDTHADREHRARSFKDRQTITAVVKGQRSRAAAAGIGNTLTVDEWVAILEAFRYGCAYCLRPASVMDHVTPVAGGGSNSFHNVVPACWPCNSSKKAKDVVDWLHGRGECVSVILDRIDEAHSKAWMFI